MNVRFITPRRWPTRTAERERDMYMVYETSGVFHRSVRGAFETFEAACDYVQALRPICFEVDEDHPGCADAFLPGGLVYAIEGGK